MTKYGPFIFGQKSESNIELQQRLAHAGYYTSTVDGIFGRDTASAITAMQIKKGYPATGRVDGAIVKDLFPEGVATQEKKKVVKSSWLSGIVGTTAFKYVVAMVATYIATKIGIDQASLEALIVQLVGVAAGVWGMWEASKSKIVIEGQKISVNDLTTAQQVEVKEMVADVKAHQ